MSITAIHLPVIPAPAADAVADPEGRAAFIAGLHDLAAALENHPEIPLPSTGRLDPVTIHFLAGDDPQAARDAAAKALGCPEWREGTADYRGTLGGVYRDLHGCLGDLLLRLVAPGDGDEPDDEAAGETGAAPEAGSKGDTEPEAATDDDTEAA
jgi:hypothetical protein